MAPLKILICGSGIGGPSLAFWLNRAGHNVTIVERHADLRASGAQIDLRAQGIQVVRRMGLLDTVRTKTVDEDGSMLVDRQGNVKATFMANKSGKGAQTLTSEYEIMRGDLVQILYDATKDDIKYVFGTSVEHFEQDENGVTVHFSDGRTDVFDVLVGADGQGSRIRKAILPQDAPDPYRRIGIYLAYWIVPHAETDNKFLRFCSATRGRVMMARSHSASETQAVFAAKDDSEEMRSLPRASVEKQKEVWAQKFRGAGWESERFIDGMKDTENFYCQEVIQVRSDTWSKGRVVLMGDAAHCPSPFTGMGTTSALCGAYVLAGEISRNSGDLKQAFANYENALRPFVDEIQKLSAATVRLAYVESEFGVWVFNLIASVLSFFRIPELMARFSKEERGGWMLPEYPEMKSAGNP